jgi:ubiquinone/menaquinone biosynthesis C-methylase UbiE
MTTIAMPKPHGDRPIKGLVAKWYASNTAEMMNEYVDLARRIAGELAPASSVLEVAPGPGYFSIELAKLGRFSITGLDLSPTFVKMASQKAAEAGVNVDFMQGSASNMPLPKESFDFLLCRAAFKNFADPVGALREICRVLKPGGRALIIDLNHDASPDETVRAVDGMSLSGFNKTLTKLIFRHFLLRSAYTRAQFEHMLGQVNCSRFEINQQGIGFEVSVWK